MTRTHDLRFAKRALYPSELRVRGISLAQSKLAETHIVAMSINVNELEIDPLFTFVNDWIDASIPAFVTAKIRFVTHPTLAPDKCLLFYRFPKVETLPQHDDFRSSSVLGSAVKLVIRGPKL